MVEKEKILTVGQKVALSLFLSLLIFAVTVIVSQTGLYSQMEKTIFSQPKVHEKQTYLLKVSDACENYVNEIDKAIFLDDDGYLRNHFIESYLKIDPSENETSNRRRITENLFTQFEGLEGIRVIDERQNLCYSSFYDTDLSDDENNKNLKNYKRYKNYAEVASKEQLLSYDLIKMSNCHHLDSKILMDTTRNEIVYSFFYQPKKLSDNVGAIKTATFVFYFDTDSFEKHFLTDRILNFGDRLVPVSSLQNPEIYGFLVTQDYDNLQDVKNALLNFWNKNRKNTRFGMENIFEHNDGTTLVMLSIPNEGKKINISGVYSSSIFVLPKEISVVIYASLFISLQLILFLLLSLKVDYSIVIKRRIKRLQYEIITEFLNDKADLDWNTIAKQIESKKNSFSEDIKKSFGKKGLKYSAQIDYVLEKSWEDIISVLKNSSNISTEVNLMNEIKKMLEEIIGSGSVHYKAEKVVTPIPVVVNQPQTFSDSLETESEIKTEPETQKTDSFEKIQKDDAIIPNNVHLYSDADDKMTYDEQKNPLYEELDHSESALANENPASVNSENLSETEDVEEIEALDEVEDIEEIEEAEEVEEIEDAEEIEEAEEVEDAEILDDEGVVIQKKKKLVHYEQDDNTFIDSEEVVFPTVSNVFAEELCLGNEYSGFKTENKQTVTPKIEIVTPFFSFTPNFTPKAEENSEILECEELDHQNQFSLTQFAASYTVGEIETAAPEKTEAIIEKDGVFSISQDLNYTDIIQDESFKSLVESVLK